MSNCNKCDTLLTNINWYQSRQNNYSYLCISCNHQYNIQASRNIKVDIVNHYGGKCACCSCDIIEFLSIDHCDNLGGEHRKILQKEMGHQYQIMGGVKFYQWLKNNNYPQENYQLLCFSCNLAKAWCDICPCKTGNNFIFEILPKIIQDKNNPICRICHLSLTNDNWRMYDQKHYNYICVKCDRQRAQLNKIKLKLEVINHYGGNCDCCGCSILHFLTIDHVEQDGAIERVNGKGSGHQFYQWLKNNHYPENKYRVLCANCNCSMGFYGYCPHQLKNEKIN